LTPIGFAIWRIFITAEDGCFHYGFRFKSTELGCNADIKYFEQVVRTLNPTAEFGVTSNLDYPKHLLGYINVCRKKIAEPEVSPSLSELVISYEDFDEELSDVEASVSHEFTLGGEGTPPVLEDQSIDKPPLSSFSESEPERQPESSIEEGKADSIEDVDVVEVAQTSTEFQRPRRILPIGRSPFRPAAELHQKFPNTLRSQVDYRRRPGPPEGLPPRPMKRMKNLADMPK
jgi:hypothetical protein